MIKKTLFVLAATGALAGCATTETATPANGAEPKDEVVYRTGSNIPTRQKAGSSDGVSVYGQESLDRARSSTAPVPRAGIPGSGPGN